MTLGRLADPVIYSVPRTLMHRLASRKRGAGAEEKKSVQGFDPRLRPERDAVEENPHDLPFAFFYLLGGGYAAGQPRPADLAGYRRTGQRRHTRTGPVGYPVAVPTGGLDG